MKFKILIAKNRSMCYNLSENVARCLGGGWCFGISAEVISSH
nr:MAG TPA: hypothetical protein [Caudoviricetes sp.]